MAESLRPTTATSFLRMLDIHAMHSILIRLDKVALSLVALVSKVLTSPAQEAHEWQERIKNRLVFDWRLTAIPSGWRFPWLADFTQNYMVARDLDVVLHNNDLALFLINGSETLRVRGVDCFDVSNSINVHCIYQRTYVFQPQRMSFSVSWYNGKTTTTSEASRANFNPDATVDYYTSIISFVGDTVVSYDGTTKTWEHRYRLSDEFRFLRRGLVLASANSRGHFLFHLKSESTFTDGVSEITLDHVVRYNEDVSSDYDSDEDERPRTVNIVHFTGSPVTYRAPSYAINSMFQVYPVNDFFIFLPKNRSNIKTAAYVFTPTKIHGVWHGLFQKLPAPVVESTYGPNDFLIHVTANTVSYNFRGIGAFDLSVTLARSAAVV